MRDCDGHNRCPVCHVVIGDDVDGCEIHDDLLQLSHVELVRRLDEAQQKLVKAWVDATNAGAA